MLNREEDEEKCKGSNALFGLVISSDLLVGLLAGMNSATPYGAIISSSLPRILEYR